MGNPSLCVTLSILIPLLVSQTASEGCDFIDIGLVIDSSGSTTSSAAHWQTMKRFLNEFVDSLDVGPTRVRIGAINYAGDAKVEFRLNRYTTRDQYKLALSRMVALGTSTSTSTALRLLREDLFGLGNGKRQGIAKLVIVLTDGRVREGVEQVKEQADLIKQDGVYIVPIGLGNDVNLSLLREMATSANEVTTIESDHVLADLVTILRRVCTVTSLNRRACPADIALVLDASSSIVFQTTDNWRVMLGFASSIVDSFSVAENVTRFGVLKFSTVAQKEIELNDYYDRVELLEAISKVNHTGGKTNLADALRRTRTEVFVPVRGDRAAVKNIMILVTDGRSNLETRSTQTEAQENKKAGIEMFMVGITEDVNRAELRAVASDPDSNHVFYVNEFNQLDTHLKAIIDKACEEPPAPVPCGEAPVDLAILLDRSGSICDNDDSQTYNSSKAACANWNNVINFIVDIVSHLKIHSNHVRVAMVTFSTKAQLRWNLQGYSSRDALINAIRSINYAGGWTNTYGALNIMRTQVFGLSPGDRSNVRNIGLIVTDGVPTRNEALTPGEAQMVHNDKIQMIAVGVTNLVDEKTLKYISSAPRKQDKDWFATDDFDTLQTISRTISQDALC